MPIVPQVKCRRCGATFSSLSSRCPNCGTRRVSQSSRTPGTTPSTVKGTAAYDRAAANTKWQMIFGLILVVAVILAVIIMVSTGIDGSGSSAKPPRATVEVSTEPVVETPVVTPTQMPTVESVIITYYGTPKDDVTMEVGTEPLAFTASVTPRDLQDVAANTVWSSSDETVITVSRTDDGGCEVTAVGSGTATLTCTVFGVSAQCIFRTWSK